MSSAKTIALFGGAFDPPTIGHGNIAKYLTEKNIVDEVWFMPCYVSYYGKNMAKFKDRHKMLMLMIKDLNVKADVSSFEKDIKSTAGTNVIMEKFLKCYNDYKFYFVIGMDNAMKIRTWPGWEELIQMVPFIIVPRKDDNNETPDDNSNNKKNTDGADWYMRGPHIYLNEMEANDISSTNVRTNLKDGNYKNLTDNVSKYIQDERLYR